MVQALSKYRISDPVLTNVAHGYYQADSIAPFVAPVVPVMTRAGKIIKFTKESFAVQQTRRAPGENIKRVGVTYDNESYFLYQHAVGAEIPIELYEEALNGEAKVNLREMAVSRAAAIIAQSWEQEVIDVITDATNYETSLVISATGAEKFDNVGTDPERFIQAVKEAIRAQVGIYPTRAIIDPQTYNALKFAEIFRDRVKYTNTGSITLDMLAQWIGLPGGIKVAQRVYLNDEGLLQDFMPRGTMVLFYNPEDEIGSQGSQATFMPDEMADNARPSAFYTYQLQGYPVVEPERYDKDRKVFVSDVCAEQNVVPVGLGNTGKIGAAALLTDLLEPA